MSTYSNQFYSQINQGQVAQAYFVDKIYNHTKTEGFFIEAGAVDGERLSNTIFLELERQWTGLLVEPNPELYEILLTRKRKVWSIGHCLSMSPRPENVLFDAVDIFGGILQKGACKDSRL